MSLEANAPKNARARRLAGCRDGNAGHRALPQFAVQGDVPELGARPKRASRRRRQLLVRSDPADLWPGRQTRRGRRMSQRGARLLRRAWVTRPGTSPKSWMTPNLWWRECARSTTRDVPTSAFSVSYREATTHADPDPRFPLENAGFLSSVRRPQRGGLSGRLAAVRAGPAPC